MADENGTAPQKDPLAPLELYGVLPRDPLNVLVGTRRLKLEEPTQLVVKRVIGLFKRAKREEGAEFSWASFVLERTGEIAAILLDTRANREACGAKGSEEFTTLVLETMTASQGATMAAAVLEVFDLEELLKQLRAPKEKLEAKLAQLGVNLRLVDDPAS